MAFVRLNLAVFLFLTFGLAGVAGAAQINTAPGGGPWHDPNTWLGLQVPTAGDQVLLNAPVVLTGMGVCASLDVSASGSLAGATDTPTLKVYGPVTNEGTISRGLYILNLEVSGDIHNAGTWESTQIAVFGTDGPTISHDLGAPIRSGLAVSPGAGTVLTAITPLNITGDIDMTGGRLDLNPDCPLNLHQGRFSGPMNAAGNEMRFLSWSYLQACSIDDVILVGEVEASHLVEFTTRVTVMDTLQNLSSSGGGAVIVHGDMINNGLITAPQYSFPVSISGDLETHGQVNCTQLMFTGVGVEHRLRMGPEGIIHAPVFLPEFQASTIIAETPVRFARVLGLGIGYLILEPGASLGFSGFGGVGSGTIVANGNSITHDGQSGIGSVTIDQGVLVGTVPLLSDVLCTNGLTVEGTLTSGQWIDSDITIEGLFRNQGTTTDGARPVTITALGDVANTGVLDNSTILLSGSADQQVGIGDGIACAEFILESGLTGPGWQWYRDNEPLPGETSSQLVWDSVGAEDHGLYVCRVGETTSRSVMISESLNASPVPMAGQFALGQNYPNPFNPATEIAFRLHAAGDVSLVVYDLAGREVERLVEGSLGAGQHVVRWEPREAASGVYFYRLNAGGSVLTKRCTLLK